MKKAISFVLAILLLSYKAQALQESNCTIISKQMLTKHNSTAKTDNNKTSDANTTTKPKKKQSIGKTILQIIITPVFVAGFIVAVVVTSPLFLLDAIFTKKKSKQTNP